MSGRIKQAALGTFAGLCLLANAAMATCPGDCDGNGRVTIDELVRGVSIVLDVSAVDTCLPLDSSTDGSVQVNEIVHAVNAALRGCSDAPTPTPEPDLPSPHLSISGDKDVYIVGEEVKLTLQFQNALPEPLSFALGASSIMAATITRDSQPVPVVRVCCSKASGITKASSVTLQPGEVYSVPLSRLVVDRGVGNWIRAIQRNQEPIAPDNRPRGLLLTLDPRPRDGNQERLHYILEGPGLYTITLAYEFSDITSAPNASTVNSLGISDIFTFRLLPASE